MHLRGGWLSKNAKSRSLYMNKVNAHLRVNSATRILTTFFATPTAYDIKPKHALRNPPLKD